LQALTWSKLYGTIQLSRVIKGLLCLGEMVSSASFADDVVPSGRILCALLERGALAYLQPKGKYQVF